MPIPIKKIFRHLLRLRSLNLQEYIIAKSGKLVVGAVWLQGELDSGNGRLQDPQLREVARIHKKLLLFGRPKANAKFKGLRRESRSLQDAGVKRLGRAFMADIADKYISTGTGDRDGRP
jgi:hypothetical protein